MRDSIPASTPSVPTVNGKPWYKSKTLWFNGLALVLGMVEMQFKLLEQYIPAAVFPALAFVLAVVNVLLRFITTTALIVPRVDQPAPVPPAQGGYVNLLAWLPALKWFGTAALLAWGVYCIYSEGRDANEAKWIKKEAAQAKADEAERERIAKLGRIAAEYEIQEQIRAAERSAHLSGVMNHARQQFSLVAKSRPLPVLQNNLAHHQGDGRAGAPVEGGKPLQEQRLADASEPDLVLTLGAVWLWNAALTGQASGAAGACRVDAATGQASAACSDSSGLDIDAALANHTANAQACAADRARHQRLIDYLNSLQPSLSK